MIQKTLVILGSGYTARFVLPLASNRYTTVWATSRNPGQNLQEVPSTHRIRFDLSDPETWAHLPPESDFLWCFPATPLDLVKQFSAHVQSPHRRLVILGSTSAYDIGPCTEHPPPCIDETTPVDLSKPRVQGEEYLRLHAGAVVLRVAGIYGPHRNPLEWIKAGRVGPSGKFVNLIHVEDLAAICLAALERGHSGDAYNVSDGTPRTWKDICDTAHARWEIVASPVSAFQETGKRISNAKLIKTLGYRLQHPDLYDELDRL